MAGWTSTDRENIIWDGTLEAKNKIKSNNLDVNNIGAMSTYSGDETADDISITPSSPGALITFGRLSNTASNGTTVKMRNRGGDKGIVFNQGTVVISTLTLPTGITTGAILEARSTTAGFLPPKMTAAQMVAIANPPDALMVWNTSSSALMVASGAAWYRVTLTVT